MSNREKSRLIKLAFILLGLILCSIITLTYFTLRSRSFKVKQENIKIEVPKKANPNLSQAVSKTLEENPIDFKNWQERNKDIYAFIEVKGTPISYPILRSNDREEDYYLETTIDHQQVLPGSIYTQMVNDDKFNDFVTVIYGHDMLDGTYFGCLREYINREYFEKNYKIMVYLPEEKLEYHILGEVVMDDRLIPAFYDVKKREGRDEFFAYLKSSKEIENQWVENTSLENEDKLLVLSTCIGPRPENRRVIIGKLVKREEVKPRG